jgi:hypothetical protein
VDPGLVDQKALAQFLVFVPFAVFFPQILEDSPKPLHNGIQFSTTLTPRYVCYLGAESATLCGILSYMQDVWVCSSRAHGVHAALCMGVARSDDQVGEVPWVSSVFASTVPARIRTFPSLVVV